MDLNPEPTPYRGVALPLSYKGMVGSVGVEPTVKLVLSEPRLPFRHEPVVGTLGRIRTCNSLILNQVTLPFCPRARNRLVLAEGLEPTTFHL